MISKIKNKKEENQKDIVIAKISNLTIGMNPQCILFLPSTTYTRSFLRMKALLNLLMASLLRQVFCTSATLLTTSCCIFRRPP